MKNDENKVFDKKKLIEILSVNAENIKRIDRRIASELERRIGFAEDCVKILLGGKEEMAYLFDMLFDTEELNYDSYFVSENVIRENIFPCNYIFRCIDETHRLTEYMQYYDEIQYKRVFSDDTFFEVYGKTTADMKLTLNEKMTFSKLTSYINLCGFQVRQLNYSSEENDVHLALDIQNKSYMFNVFTGLIRCYKVNFIYINLQ